MEQIGSIDDTERSKPILIVGTHADLLTKQERLQRSEQVQLMYPVSKSYGSRQEVHGHFTLNVIAGINPSPVFIYCDINCN